MDIPKFFKQPLSWALALLPGFPPQVLDISSIASYLPATNWITPASFIIATMETRLVAIVAYYVISATLRWTRVIS